MTEPVAAPPRPKRDRVKREPVRGYPGISKLHRAKGDVYEVRWRAGGTGYSATFPGLKEAKAHLIAQQHAVQRGEFIRPAARRTTFGELAEQWLTSYPRKPSTLRGYRHVLAVWLKPWSSRPIASLSYRDAVAVFAAMREADRRGQTMRNVFTVMKGVFDHAVRERCLSENPVAAHRKYLLRVDEEPYEANFLTADQVETLASALPHVYGLVVRLAAWSGLRAGELMGLSVRNADPLRRSVRVAETVRWAKGPAWHADTPKSARSRRTVPEIPPAIITDLQALAAARDLGPDDYLFGEDGAPLNWERFYRRHFRPAARATGVPDLRGHELRHTYASLMREHLDLFELSRRMGHSTHRITADLYAHRYEEENVERPTASALRRQRPALGSPAR